MIRPPVLVQETLDPDMEAWLSEHQLGVLKNTLAWHGYISLGLLKDLNTEEVEELLALLRLGHAARLRRALKSLGHDEMAGRARAMSASASRPHAEEVEMAEASRHQDSGAARSSSSSTPLRPGLRVCLQGLERRAELNGSQGHLSAFNSQTGRWELTLQGGKGSIRVRPENVVPLENAAHVSESDIPEEFRCVITRELMERPVITSDGHTYERSAIAKWLEEHNTSPKTGRELPDKVLKPNHALRAQIMAFRESRGLPPLPPWEPESQEVVQAPRPSQSNQGLQIQSHTIMFAPPGHVMGPPGHLPPGIMRGMGMPPHMPGHMAGEIDVNRLVSLMEGRPDLVQTLQGAFMEVNPGADAGQLNSLNLAEATIQEPHLLSAFARWMHTTPDQQVLQILQPPGIPHFPGVPAGPGDHALFRAAREGDTGVLERLLGDRSGSRLTEDLAPNGDSLLHAAAWHGQSQVAQMLLARDHPVGYASRNRSAPLHYAAWQGQVEVAKVLIDGQANLEQRMHGGDTPLHQAAWQGHLPMLQLLTDRGASVFALKDDGDTALALSAFRGHLESSRELLRRMIGNDTADASFWNRMRNYHGCGPLHTGASSGNADVVRLLLDANAPTSDRNDIEDTVLHRAIHSGSEESVSLLLEHRAQLEAARASDEQTPLQLAILEGYTRMSKYLIELRASLEHTRADGMKAIHVAVLREASFLPRAGEGSVVALLAAARADPQVRSRTGLTPLALILSPGLNAPHRTTALRAIIDAKADLNAPSCPDGSRPLHSAVTHNMQGEAAVLLERSADANLSRPDGCTPLHLAVLKGALPFVELLLRSRADPTQTTRNNLSAVDLARQTGFEALARRLQQET